MATATAYLDRVLPAIDRLADRFTAVVAAAPDPAAPIPGSDWTVREATAHVVTVTRRFSDRPEGRGTWVRDPRELGALNDAQIEALGDLDMAALADRLRRELAALTAQVRAYGESPPSFTFHGGEEVAADVALGILLGELVVHGWDIAAATGRDYTCEPELLQAACQFVEQAVAQNPNGSPGMFGPPVQVPDNASQLDRLIGLTGRDPAWRPDGDN